MFDNKLDIEKALRSLPTSSQGEMESARLRILEQLKADDGRPLVHPLVGFDSSNRIRRRRALFVPATAVAVIAVVAFFMTPKSAPALLESTNASVAYGATVRSGAAGDIIQLVDSTRIEMRAESELELEKVPDGVRIMLHSGGVIVNAAKQKSGRHLYVQTKDVLVSAVGTIFLVRAEEKGSRVAVIEGEVRVQQGSLDRKLLSGEHVTSNPAMPALPVKDEVAWSRQAETHLAMLQQAAPREGENREPSTKPVVAGFRVGGRVILSPGPRIQPPTLALREVIDNGGTREERERRLLAQRNYLTGMRPDGSFTFSNVPAGSYSLDSGSLDGMTVAVKVTDRDVPDVRVVVPFKASAEGHIVMDDGNPLPVEPLPVLWVLSAARGKTVNPVTSSPDGSFHVSLYGGDNQIEVDPLQRGYSLKSISYGGQELTPGSDPRWWGPIQLEGSAKEFLITLTGKPADPLPVFKMSGKARNLPTEFFDGTTRRLRLVRKGGLPPFSTELLSDGSFEFPKVEQGFYSLSLETGPALVESIRVRDTDIDDLILDFQNNPFPEHSSNRRDIFAGGPDMALEGTLTQAITVIKSDEGPRVGLGAVAPDITYQAVPRRRLDDYYFRIAVENPAPGMPRSLAVLVMNQNPADTELEKLKVGTRARVVVRPAKDGASRVLLVPQNGLDAVAGVFIINK